MKISEKGLGLKLSSCISTYCVYTWMHTQCTHVHQSDSSFEPRWYSQNTFSLVTLYSCLPTRLLGCMFANIWRFPLLPKFIHLSKSPLDFLLHLGCLTYVLRHFRYKMCANMLQLLELCNIDTYVTLLDSVCPGDQCYIPNACSSDFLKGVVWNSASQMLMHMQTTWELWLK